MSLDSILCRFIIRQICSLGRYRFSLPLLENIVFKLTGDYARAFRGLRPQSSYSDSLALTTWRVSRREQDSLHARSSLLSHEDPSIDRDARPPEHEQNRTHAIYDK